MLKSLLAAALLALALVPLPPGPARAGEVRRIPVTFAPGTQGATLEGSLRGDDSIEYSLAARAGQTMTVELRARNTSVNFNIRAPGSDTALFMGAVSGDRFEGALPASGTYVIQVFLVRAAARRNERADVSIQVRIAGAGQRP